MLIPLRVPDRVAATELPSISHKLSRLSALRSALVDAQGERHEDRAGRHDSMRR